MSEPPAKKLKTDEEANTPEAAKAEEPKEVETDSLPDSRPKLKEPVVFLAEESTLNVMPTAHGNMLVPLSDGGLQYLLAGTRATAGVKCGRYMFEIKIVEFVNPPEEQQARLNRSPALRNQLRVGFSTAGSTLFLGDTDDSVCFDAEGSFVHSKKKTVLPTSARCSREEIIAVVLNLDTSSAGGNTLSLFKDGIRASDPMPLPDCLKGKELYPAVTFRNLTLHYNFGPAPDAPLPFKCRMIQDASQSDVTITSPSPAPKDGKYEVLFPISLPDEGTFDWLDLFLEKNPNYTELSDRAIVSWAEKSSVWRQKGYGAGSKTSNDKPEMNFGLPFMDDLSVRRVLQAVAPLHQRNYIVMEVKSNLVKIERRDLLAKWYCPSFRRIAVVMIGEPSNPVKRRGQELTLKAKQEALDTEFRAKQAEAKRKLLVEKRQKELDKARRKAERARKRAEEEQARKAVVEAKRKEAADKGEVFEEPPEDEKKEEESEEEVEMEEVEEPEGEPPKASLTPEEKLLWFRKNPTPDLTSYSMSTSFMKFALPEENEGFDEIRYDWQKAEPCREYLKKWVLERKLTTRIEELNPSDWFAGKWKDWQKVLQSWHGKQTAYKAAVAKAAEDEAAREAAKKARQALKEAKEKAAAEKAAAGQHADESAEPAKDDDKVEEDAVAEEAEAKEKEVVKVDFDKLDVFGVEDIADLGDGTPLFAQFGFEDWTVMSFRFELHLLAHGFRRDVNDPDRLGIHVEHLPFYYNKYFKKQLNLKFFGVETVKELIEHVRDTATINKHQVLEAHLPDDLESLGIFVMLTEEARRDRIRRVDLGDESARLKIMQPSLVSGGQVGVPAVSAATAVFRPALPGAMAQPITGAGAAAVRPGAGVPPGAAVGQQTWRAGKPQGWSPYPAQGSPFRQPTAYGGQPAGRPPFQPAWRNWGGR
eukprot:TRINITY_DN42919_c0_g1_i1.p1 TRINITY_DN42919_c0_g1~~TRINITY_DN42919_c0_g1_i1.p1  ORF type:complete len:927 (+),score=183.65 TRINITY_DN42919_c0_g1_i1:88-2868(+)